MHTNTERDRKDSKKIRNKNYSWKSREWTVVTPCNDQLN